MSYQLELAVGDTKAFASRVYRRCRDCPGEELASLAPSVRQSANILEDLEDHLTSRPLSTKHETRLYELLAPIKTLLEQIQDLAKEVSLQPFSTRAAWVEFNNTKITKAKLELEEVTTNVHAFYKSLTRSNEGRISRTLSNLVRDGDEKRLTLLRQSVYGQDQAAWGDVLTDFENNGVSKGETTAHQSFVEGWVKRSLPAVAETTNDAFEARYQQPRQSFSMETPISPLERVQSFASFGPLPVQSNQFEHIGTSETQRNNSSINDQTHLAQKLHEIENHTAIPQSSILDAVNRKSSEVVPAPAPVEPSRRAPPPPAPRYYQQTAHGPTTVSRSSSSVYSEDSSKKTSTYVENSNGTTPDYAQLPTLKESPVRKHNLATADQRSTMSHEDHDDDSDDDLFNSTPSRPKPVETFSTGSLEVSSFRALVAPQMEPTISGPLPSALFEHDPKAYVASQAGSSPANGENSAPPESTLLQPNVTLNAEREAGKHLPPPPSAESTSLRSVRSNRTSKNTLGLQLSSVPSSLVGSSAIPSPVDLTELDLRRNAEIIVASIAMNKWSDAQDLISKQITGVEYGAFVLLNEEPVQPSIKFLNFLQGVCFSFHGDFIEAKLRFDEVLKDVFLRNYHLDAIEAAAAKWLGDTCILLNQSMDAALSYAVCLGGIIASFGAKDRRALALAEDIRLLNHFTGSLHMLKNIGKGYAGSAFNKDPTTVFNNAPTTWKRTMVYNTLDYCYKPNQPQPLNNGSARDIKNSLYEMDPSYLMHPVATFDRFPYDQDPFFNTTNAINLLSAVSKPKSDIEIDRISTSSLGRSKSLFYKTNKGAPWLVSNLRTCLDSHAIEYKILQNNFLLRLSQMHSRIAYYQCFSIRLRKLPFRNTFGLKMTKVLLVTRSFDKNDKVLKPLVDDSMSITSDAEPDPETTRASLMHRIATFLAECEKPNGRPAISMSNIPDVPRYELPDIVTPTQESEIPPVPQALTTLTTTPATPPPIASTAPTTLTTTTTTPATPAPIASTAPTGPVELEAIAPRKKWWKIEKNSETANLPPPNNVIELPA